MEPKAAKSLKSSFSTTGRFAIEKLVEKWLLEPYTTSLLVNGMFEELRYALCVKVAVWAKAKHATGVQSVHLLDVHSPPHSLHTANS